MQNPISSPGDPIFYLHHTYLDKLWWTWQSRNLSARLTDISGSNVQDPCIGFPEDGQGFLIPGTNQTAPFPFPPFPNGTFPFPGAPNGTNGTGPGVPGGFPGGFPGNGTACNKTVPVEWTRNPGDGGGNVTTLGHVLNMFGIVGNATIGEVMDIGAPRLCYEYV